MYINSLVNTGLNAIREGKHASYKLDIHLLKETAPHLSLAYVQMRKFIEPIFISFY